MTAVVAAFYQEKALVGAFSVILQLNRSIYLRLKSLLSTLFTRYPWIQEKVQEELDRVVGGDRCPGLADRARLPYTEAVLMEVQRHAHVLPLGVRHRSAGAQF